MVKIRIRLNRSSRKTVTLSDSLPYLNYFVFILLIETRMIRMKGMLG